MVGTSRECESESHTHVRWLPGRHLVHIDVNNFGSHHLTDDIIKSRIVTNDESWDISASSGDNLSIL